MKNEEMVVLQAPLRFKAAAFLLFLSVPLIALEVAISARVPWWDLPWVSLGYWAIAWTLITIPLVTWVLSAKRWAWNLCLILSVLWVLASLWTTIRLRYPPLGFFTLFLTFFLFLELIWLRAELGRSYMDPALAWYQGLPKAIQGLRAWILQGEEKLELSVSRMDQDGVIVFHPRLSSNCVAYFSALRPQTRIDLQLEFKGHQVSCGASAVLILAQASGAGLQLHQPSSDLRKQISDFVELLRGEGHVE